MFEVNGKKFNTPEEAITYLEELKKEAQEKQKREQIDKRISIAMVTEGKKRYFVCSLASDENKSMYVHAMVEGIFGNRYKIEQGKVRERYVVVPLGVTNSLYIAVKKFLKENHDLNDVTQNWSDVNLGVDESVSDRILVSDFDLMQKKNEEMDKELATWKDLLELLTGISFTNEGRKSAEKEMEY